MIAKDRRPKPPAICEPLLVVTFRNQQVIAAQWRHNSESCYVRGCGGTVTELPLDFENWPTRTEITNRTGN